MNEYLDPHWDTAALVVIDLQRDTLPGGALTVAGTDEIVERVVRLVEAFRAAGRPIVHVVRLYEGSDVDPPRRAAVEGGAALFAPGTEGAEVAPGVLPDGAALDPALLLAGAPQIVGTDEIVLYKPRWSAFYRTDLDAWLRDRDVDTVVVAGCNLPNCPRATLFDASARDYRGVIVPDATSRATRERVADLALIGVRAVSADAVVQALGDR